jgi:hypothetical protein
VVPGSSRPRRLLRSVISRSGYISACSKDQAITAL